MNATRGAIRRPDCRSGAAPTAITAGPPRREASFGQIPFELGAQDRLRAVLAQDVRR